jgi:uncharacterized phage protein gp47/JayE
MFQIKDFASITASSINWMRSMQKKVTDFSIGSVARTLLEAAATEIEELYIQMFVGLKEAIPVAIYKTFDFGLQPASPASGTVRVFVTSSAQDLVIPAKSVFQPEGYSLTFESQADAIVPAGDTQIDISMLASVPGAVGNVPAGTAFTPTQTITGFVSAEALFTFSLGSDLETEEQRKLRFTAFIATLNRGTKRALEYGLTLAVVLDPSGNISERVVYSRIDEPWLTDPLQPVALVNVYIHDGVTGASSDLINRAQEVLDGYYDENGDPVTGWKAAGVKVVVIAATTASTAVAGDLTIAAGFQTADVQAEVVSAVADYIARLSIGDDVLRSEIITAAMNVDGVVDFIPSVPSGNVAVSSTAKAMPGTITITVV